MVAVFAAAVRPPRRPLRRARLVGSLLISVPLPAAVAMRLLHVLPATADQAAFVAGAAAFAIGAYLVLGRDDQDWSRGGDDAPEPAWWPDFERPFRAYVDDLSRRRERVRIS